MVFALQLLLNVDQIRIHIIVTVRRFSTVFVRFVVSLEIIGVGETYARRMREIYFIQKAGVK